MSQKNSSNKKLLIKISISVVAGLLLFYAIIVWAILQ